MSVCVYPAFARPLGPISENPDLVQVPVNHSSHLAMRNVPPDSGNSGIYAGEIELRRGGVYSRNVETEKA